MRHLVVVAAQRQIEELEAFAHASSAFSGGDATELVRWFTWRTDRLVENDLAALRGLEDFEGEPGAPFSARWADVAQAGGAAYPKLGTSFNRLEHIGVVERLGRDRKGRTLWRLNRTAAPLDIAA